MNNDWFQDGKNSAQREPVPIDLILKNPNRWALALNWISSSFLWAPASSLQLEAMIQAWYKRFSNASLFKILLPSKTANMHQEELPANGTCLWPVCPNTSSNSLEQVHHHMTGHVHNFAHSCILGGSVRWPSHALHCQYNPKSCFTGINIVVYVLFACFTCLLGLPPAQLACSLFSVHHTIWFILPPPHTAAWCVFTISVANAALLKIVFSPLGRMIEGQC